MHFPLGVFAPVSQASSRRLCEEDTLQEGWPHHPGKWSSYGSGFCCPSPLHAGQAEWIQHFRCSVAQATAGSEAQAMAAAHQVSSECSDYNSPPKRENNTKPVTGKDKSEVACKLLAAPSKTWGSPLAVKSSGRCFFVICAVFCISSLGTVRAWLEIRKGVSEGHSPHLPWLSPQGRKLTEKTDSFWLCHATTARENEVLIKWRSSFFFNSFTTALFSKLMHMSTLVRSS